MSSHETHPRTPKKPWFEGRVGQERVVAIIALLVATIVIAIGFKMDVFSGNDDANYDYWNGTPSPSPTAQS